jgi:Ca-activated chloride channel homolog
MKKLMRCLYCGLLQDEPSGVKTCQRCGGELVYEQPDTGAVQGSYVNAQMELDQINAPAGQTIDRHLLITLKTPNKVPSKFQAETESGRPPLGFSVILDVSGSMHGEKIEYTKRALQLASTLLKDGDHLAMTVFSDKAKVLMPAEKVNPDSKRRFTGLIDETMPQGMTALYKGLDLGLKETEKFPSENKLTLLLSDGQANVGETDLEIIGSLAKEAAESGMIVSTLGVGMNYNEALMTEIALQGRGRFYHIQSPDEIVPYLTGELGEAADMAVRDVKIHIHLPEGSALIPLSASYHCEIKDQEAIISIGDIPIDLEVEIPLRLTLFSGKPGQRLSIKGDITYLSPSDSLLKVHLNRVTVRFIKKGNFLPDMGVIKPVAARVAEQMRAAQLLHYSRAVSRGNKQELKNSEEERSRVMDYFKKLDPDQREKMSQMMAHDLDEVRYASPNSKRTLQNAYQAQRFMRDLKKHH